MSPRHQSTLIIISPATPPTIKLPLKYVMLVNVRGGLRMFAEVRQPVQSDSEFNETGYCSIVVLSAYKESRTLSPKP